MVNMIAFLVRVVRDAMAMVGDRGHGRVKTAMERRVARARTVTVIASFCVCITAGGTPNRGGENISRFGYARSVEVHRRFTARRA
jgi:hypothetical protein